MAPDRNDRTDPETPAALRKERPTLSEIDLGTPSLPPPARPSSEPPDATEAERLWQGMAGMDRTMRAMASSYQADREVRRIRELRLLIVSVIGALAAAAATIIAALR